MHYACATRSWVRRSIHDEPTAEGLLVSALLAVALTAAVATLIAVAVHELQLRLEQWDYRRHLED